MDRTSTRAVVDALAEEPRPPAALVDATEFARPTVHDCLRDLRERGLVEKSDGAYALTHAGKRLHEINGDRLAKLGRIEDITPFLNYLPEFDPPLPVDRLCGDDVVMGTEDRPHRASHYCRRRLQEANPENVLVLVSTLSPALIEGYKHAIDSAKEARVVLDATVRDPFEEHVLPGSADRSSVDVHDSDATISVDALVVDESSLVLAHGDHGMLRGVLDTDVSSVREWVKDRYRHRTRTTNRPI